MKNNIDCCDNHLIHKDLVEKCQDQLLIDTVALKISNFIKVLADSTRIKMIHLLLENELCVCDIAELLQMNQPAVSQQLKTLKQANIVIYHRVGHNVFYTLSDNCVKQMINEVKTHVLDHKI